MSSLGQTQECTDDNPGKEIYLELMINNNNKQLVTNQPPSDLLTLQYNSTLKDI